MLGMLFTSMRVRIQEHGGNYFPCPPPKKKTK